MRAVVVRSIRSVITILADARAVVVAIRPIFFITPITSMVPTITVLINDDVPMYP